MEPFPLFRNQRGVRPWIAGSSGRAKEHSERHQDSKRACVQDGNVVVDSQPVTDQERPVKEEKLLFFWVLSVFVP